MDEMGDSSAAPDSPPSTGGAAPVAPAIAAMLASRAARGDTSAFEALYRQHAGLVYASCLRLCADRARAEELAQDAFIRAWQALATFRGGTFAAWIRRIAVNVALDDLRARRGRHVELDEETPAAGAPARVTPDRLDLEQAILRLPAGARAAFVLFEIEGLGHQEIASRLGIAEATSKSQLHRARQLLREALGP